MVNELVSALQKLADVQPPTAAPVLIDNPDGKGAFVVVKNGYEVKQLGGAQKGQRRHTFHDLGSFARWLNRHAAGRDETVEIVASATAVTAGLDPIDPTADVVMCNLTTHPTAVDWCSIFGKPLDQKQLHAFLRGHVADFANADAATMLTTELRKLNIVINKDLSAELDERGFLQFQGNTGKAQVGGKIPGDFAIRIPLIMGVMIDGSDTDEVTYPLDVLVTMDVNDHGASFTLSAPSLVGVKHQARLDAVAYLEKLLDDGFMVGLGDYAVPSVGVVRNVES